MRFEYLTAKCGLRNVLMLSLGMAALLVRPAVGADKKYSLDVTAHAVGDGKVELDITTNIPGTIAVMANIDLRSQKGDDLYVGTDNGDVLVTHGVGKAILGVSKLPRGKYQADIGFYPNWGFKDAVSRATGIKNNIAITKPIEFASRGAVTASEQTSQKQNQIWVMNRALPETPWKPAEWRRRFGASVFVPVVDDTWDPSIVKDVRPSLNPEVGPIATELPELDIVDVGLASVFVDAAQLVLAPIEATHPGVGLAPDREVEHVAKVSALGCRHFFDMAPVDELGDQASSHEVRLRCFGDFLEEALKPSRLISPDAIANSLWRWRPSPETSP